MGPMQAWLQAGNLVQIPTMGEALTESGADRVVVHLAQGGLEGDQRGDVLGLSRRTVAADLAVVAQRPDMAAQLVTPSTAKRHDTLLTDPYRGVGLAQTTHNHIVEL